MSDFALADLELVRAQSRYVEAERKVMQAQSELNIAAVDLWTKIDEVKSLGFDLADELGRLRAGAQA